MNLAESIAVMAHAGQLEESTGDPYIRHITRVVDLVEGELAKEVAWLHDVIEDTKWTAVDLLNAGVTPTVVQAVKVLTRLDIERYSEYIQRVKESGNELALQVKIADLKDHFRPNCPPRLLPRYKKAWEVLVGSPWEFTR
jgi:(p)ppGpp synthase/HD superfamily hydrolase